MKQSPSKQHQSSARWTLILFVLATILLVGSVALPAGQSARVTGLLEDDERIVEPLRLLSVQLTSGVAEESAELQRFLTAGDSAALVRYQVARTRDDRDLRTMRRLAERLDLPVAVDADSLARLVDRWRGSRVGPGRPPAAAVGVAGSMSREAVRDSIVLATARLEAALADQSARGRAAATAHERSGVIINALLVMVAFAALVGVFDLMRRERRRGRRELAVRLGAEALAGAFSLEDVAEQAMSAASQLLDPATVRVVRFETAADGSRADASLFDRVLRSGHAAITTAVAVDGPDAPNGQVMIIPLGTSDSPIGAAIAFRARARRFDRDDLAWADIFGHLVTLSYDKVRLLDDARAARARLESVMESRSRLMRGFSHDVKNPLGAADGYAALLEDGVYGAVTPEQRSSITRLREAIHRALTLIDDLHELARAETGHLEIHFDRTDVGALLLAAGEEYRAAARAKRLGFNVQIEPGLPLIETDSSRVRQIVANLLSNAIKYTDAGSVTVRVRSDAFDHPDDVTHLFIDVEDTGRGIPVDKQELIFDEFARVETGKQTGLGIGLAISKHVAQALGCRLQVTSEAGKGAVFTLCIPRRSGGAADTATDAQASELITVNKHVTPDAM